MFILGNNSLMQDLFQLQQPHRFFLRERATGIRPAGHSGNGAFIYYRTVRPLLLLFQSARFASSSSRSCCSVSQAGCFSELFVLNG